jgi:alginate O-acetyltransferase complex protein AlgI
MLFNSLQFIFIFFPIVFIGYFQIARRNKQLALKWLTLASIIFYGYWSLSSLPIIIISIAFNYTSGKYISNKVNKYRREILIFSLLANLMVLIYYKYINFIIFNISEVIDYRVIDNIEIELPIGISFFTFTQMAYLYDSYLKKISENNLINYSLFVTFFPHLLAGPVLHHKQIMPQFSDIKNFKIDKYKIKCGIIIFILGLAKKLIFADSFAVYSDSLFEGVKVGEAPQLTASWLGALAYTFQMYFDFSGYSDMAVGISLIFGIMIPINFNSPFKATSVIEYWQRWHISLTKYINEYLYIPITMHFMRYGLGKSYVKENLYGLVIPTMLVMLTVGLWHGANWTFVLFGAMHGLFLIINHIWRTRKFMIIKYNQNILIVIRIIKWKLTFLCIILALIMFRSNDISTAIMIYKGMVGYNGINLNLDYSNNLFLQIIMGGVMRTYPEDVRILIPLLFISMILCLSFDNTSKISDSKKLLIKSKIGAILLSSLFVVCILKISHVSPFLYFQF